MKIRISVSALLVSAVLSTSLYAQKLTVACGAVGLERQYCQESVERWSALTGHEVRVINTPDSSTDRLAMYQLLLRERHDTVDIFQIDVVWPGLLHKNLLDMTDYISAEEINAYFPTLVDNNTVNGRLVALPWYVDTGLLYYRKDLLEKYGRDVPRTWAELEQTANTIVAAERAASPEMTGFVFQADDYEGLTCNLIEWLGSTGQKKFVSDKNQMIFQEPGASQVLDIFKRFVASDVTPSEILTFREEDARAMFQAGDAIFMRNWPYAWNLANQQDSKIAGKVGVATLPGLSAQFAGAGTLGGWQLAVTKYTREPQLAVDLVKFMTSEAEQRQRLDLGYFPTRNALYNLTPNEAIKPLFDAVGSTLVNSVARPATALGNDYKDVSRRLYYDVNEFLLTQPQSSAAFLQTLAAEITQITAQ